MEDHQILDLFWARDEQAITETHIKYGPWCSSIAYRILENTEDTEECISDTCYTAWTHIPPQRPGMLRAWLGRITRNLALTQYRKTHAHKRGSGEVALALEELEYCVSGGETPEGVLDRHQLTAAINRFLAGLGQQQRCVFMRRYWYLDPTREIAQRYGMTESQVTSLLYRLRQQLKDALLEEGIAL